MPLARLVLSARLGSSPLTKCWSTVGLRVHPWPDFECSICQQFCPTRNSLMSHQYRKHDVRYAQSWSINYIHNQSPLMKDPMLKQSRLWTSWWTVACSRTMMAFGSALNVDTTQRRFLMFRTMWRLNMSQLLDFLVLYVTSIVPQDMLWWIISPDITSRNSSIPLK